MKSDVQIRIASPGDAEKIGSLIREAFAPLENFYTTEAFAAVTPNAAEIRARFSEGAIWAALKNEEIIGTVSTVIEGKLLYIRSMAVLPSAQGLGIGRALLEAVENYAIENGFENLFLYTLPFLSGAIRLYEQNGFERGTDTSAEEFFGMPGLTMEKKLNRTGKFI